MLLEKQTKFFSEVKKCGRKGALLPQDFIDGTQFA